MICLIKIILTSRIIIASKIYFYQDIFSTVSLTTTLLHFPVMYKILYNLLISLQYELINIFMMICRSKYLLIELPIILFFTFNNL